MKKTKQKLISISLAAIMLLSLSASAFAAETNTGLEENWMETLITPVTKESNPLPVFWYDETISQEVLRINMDGLISGKFPSYTISKNSGIEFMFDFSIDHITDSTTGEVIFNSSRFDRNDSPLTFTSDVIKFSKLSPYSFVHNYTYEDGTAGSYDVVSYRNGGSVEFLKPGKYMLSYSYGYSDDTAYTSYLDNLIGAGGGYAFDTELYIDVTDTAEKYTATVNSSKVLVNGSQIAFDSYTINENNYFKLRDIAKILSGSEKQFEVSWDNSAGSIKLIPGKAYTTVGGELSISSGKAKEAVRSLSPIYLNDEIVSLKAYTIGDSNYFKLRDLGKLFNFNVSWNQESSSIEISTAETYTAD